MPSISILLIPATAADHASINARTGEYDDFGVPATILANFLRENGIVPEKCDLNSILFLLTPAEDMGKLQQLVAQLVRFEKLLQSDVPLKRFCPLFISNIRNVMRIIPCVRFVRRCTISTPAIT